MSKRSGFADRAIRSVAGEFNVPVSARFQISNAWQKKMVSQNGIGESRDVDPLSLFLEYQRFQSDAGCRGQIPNTAEFDLVISILWSRLGACWTQP